MWSLPGGYIILVDQDYDIATLSGHYQNQPQQVVALLQQASTRMKDLRIQSFEKILKKPSSNSLWEIRM